MQQTLFAVEDVDVWRNCQFPVSYVLQQRRLAHTTRTRVHVVYTNKHELEGEERGERDKTEKEGGGNERK